uniref:Uncharacterized protein n=1 Tax=Romanomermis culicivorax TaxID=13658 RepID=A0A915L162_ROMCU
MRKKILAMVFIVEKILGNSKPKRCVFWWTLKGQNSGAALRAGHGYNNDSNILSDAAVSKSTSTY